MKDAVISEDSLEIAMKKCLKGVTYKSSVARFYLNSVDEISTLHKELSEGTYKPRKPKKFKVYYPKERDIVSIPFRDRVVQRSFNDLSIYPQMTKSFIYDNAACQRGKGTDFARNRVKEMLVDFYHKYGTEGYVLKTDISKYYDSIPHDVAGYVFRKNLDDWSYEQAMNIIKHQYPGDIGFNPGSQMIQILGIALPNSIDHAIKEKYHVKYYSRYQDDSLCICQSKEFLEELLIHIEEMYAKLGLKLNKKKSKIYSLSRGFEYLGFDFRMAKTGKVLMTVSATKVKKERKHLKNMVRSCRDGKIRKEIVDAHFKGIMNYYKKGDSYKLVENMYKYYKELWEE